MFMTNIILRLFLQTTHLSSQENIQSSNYHILQIPSFFFLIKQLSEVDAIQPTPPINKNDYGSPRSRWRQSCRGQGATGGPNVNVTPRLEVPGVKKKNGRGHPNL